MESRLQGAAFLKAAAAWPEELPAGLPETCPYCVAVGAVAGAHGVPIEEATAAFLHGFVSNLVQAAIRLGVTGQEDGTRIVASLEPTVVATAARASSSTLDELGSAALVSEAAAMRHETQHSRLFRS